MSLDAVRRPSGGDAQRSLAEPGRQPARNRADAADFVLGDRHGTSCAGSSSTSSSANCGASASIVARNKPYAGGFITEHYGNPAANRHALQIEVSRALYMDEQNVTRSEHFDDVRAALTQVADRLAATATTRLSVHRDAAE